MSEDIKPYRYEPIALSNESTVVAEFVRPIEVREERYQSEAELERDLIERLKIQAYEYLRITSEADLITNLRRQLEALNKITRSPGPTTASSRKPRGFRKTMCRCSSAMTAAPRTST